MVPHLPCQYKLWIIIPIWKADIITLLLLPSQTYRNCYSYTTSILSPWVEHGATLEPFQTGLEVPKHFGTSEYKALGSFSPTLSDALPLSPPEATWCLSPSTGPYWGLCPQCSHRGSPETFPAGMQHRHRKNKQKKKKIEIICPPQDKICCGRSKGHRKCSFLGQAPEAVTPGQTLISTCIAVNPHPSTLKNRLLAARLQLLQKLIDTRKAFSWWWEIVPTTNPGLLSSTHNHPPQFLSAFYSQV